MARTGAPRPGRHDDDTAARRPHGTSSGTICNAQVKRFGGNISRTAQFVGMERSALHRKAALPRRARPKSTTMNGTAGKGGEGKSGADTSSAGVGQARTDHEDHRLRRGGRSVPASPVSSQTRRTTSPSSTATGRWYSGFSDSVDARAIVGNASLPRRARGCGAPRPPR